MRRFAAVALREIAERRFVLVAAAFAALLPFLVPLLPGMPTGDTATVRSIVALVLACAFGLGGSLLVGASVVGRELAEKRLSFHFARPLPAATVWGGKLAGGLTIVLLAEALVVLPASAVGGEFPGLPGLGLPAPVLWTLLLLAVPSFLLAWTGSVALRSRSPWLVVDLVLLVALPALPALLLNRLVRYGHAPEPSWVIAVAGVFLAALLAATFAQVAAGRTDPRRGHGAQSLTLWGVLLLGAAGAAVWTERVVDPGVDRLVNAWASPAGRSGDRILVSGSTASGSGRASYLLDLATGEERVLPLAWESAFSADGSRIAIVRGSLFPRKATLLDVVDPGRGDVATLDLPEWPDGVALSDDGGRLAVVAAGLCRVVALPSLDLLASARVPAGSGWVYEPVFVTPERVRLHPFRMAHKKSTDPLVVTDPEAAELDLRTKSVRTLARYPIAGIPFRSVKPAQGLPTEPYFRLLPSPDRSRVLVLAFGAARSVRLLEAETGRVLASFDGPEGGDSPNAAFLADGRSVVADWVPGGRRLVVLSAAGERLSEAPLPEGGARVRLGYEPAPGLLAVGTSREATGDNPRCSLADLRAGEVKPVQVLPLHRVWWSQGSFVPPPGSPATRLATEKGTGRLVLWDPATGETKPLTRGRPARK